MSRGATFPGKPGRGSATDCLGHFWKADLGHFSQAPKALALVPFFAGLLGVVMALFPPKENERAKRNWYIVGFIILGLAGFGLTFIQSIRAQSSQEAGERDRNTLTNNVEYLKGQLVALTSMVGPEARADSRRIAVALENISPSVRKLEPTEQRLSSRQVSLRQRATVIAGKILGCVSEGAAKIEPAGPRNEDIMRQPRGQPKAAQGCCFGVHAKTRNPYFRYWERVEAPVPIR